MKFSHYILLAISIGLVSYSAKGASTPVPATSEPVVTAVTGSTVTIQTGTHAGYKVTNAAQNVINSQDSYGPHNIKSYTVESGARITVDGLPSKLSDVSKGMKVWPTMGSDPTKVTALLAYTVPPPLPTPAPDPKSKTKPVVKPRGATVSKVLSLTAERITIGQSGADKAKAYLITPGTEFFVNGAKSDASGVKPGMQVQVSASGQFAAGRIEAKDGK